MTKMNTTPKFLLQTIHLELCQLNDRKHKLPSSNYLNYIKFHTYSYYPRFHTNMLIF